ncbi:hypothetical protein KM043_016094 [Ampulex compressa]|nr:hypothetical protein KM043_016094 [Ampulex compressa]
MFPGRPSTERIDGASACVPPLSSKLLPIPTTPFNHHAARFALPYPSMNGLYAFLPEFSRNENAVSIRPSGILQLFHRGVSARDVHRNIESDQNNTRFQDVATISKEILHNNGVHKMINQ